jgi:hypothetical protein
MSGKLIPIKSYFIYMGEKGPKPQLEGNRDPELRPGPEARESGAEHIPTQEEVLERFRELFSDEFTKRVLETDEKGLKVWEVEFPDKISGGTTEYRYTRGHGDPAKATSITSIQITNFDDSGMPYGGGEAMRLVDGLWVRPKRVDEK